MADANKSKLILDALQQLLEEKDIQNISVSEIAGNEIHFEYPEALAEIALIVLAVKLDNSIVPS